MQLCFNRLCIYLQSIKESLHMLCWNVTHFKTHKTNYILSFDKQPLTSVKPYKCCHVILSAFLILQNHSHGSRTALLPHTSNKWTNLVNSFSFAVESLNHLSSAKALFLLIASECYSRGSAIRTELLQPSLWKSRFTRHHEGVGGKARTSTPPIRGKHLFL